jgi:hypothetical protein
MKPEITTTRPKSRIDYHNTFEFVHYSTSKIKPFQLILVQMAFRKTGLNWQGRTRQNGKLSHERGRTEIWK